jgi:hypothetical protein
MDKYYVNRGCRIYTLLVYTYNLKIEPLYTAVLFGIPIFRNLDFRKKTCVRRTQSSV